MFPRISLTSSIVSLEVLNNESERHWLNCGVAD